METVMMKVADIKPANYNPRKTLKPGDDEYDALTRSLEKFGLAMPIIINKTTGTLVSGHQRLNVLKASGVEEVEVVLTEQSEPQEKLLNIALNKIEGDWEYNKVKEMFDEIEPDDIQFTGFSKKEIDNLFSDMEEPARSGSNTNESPRATATGNVGTGYSNSPEPVEKKREFMIFLSFPTGTAAKEWMAERGVPIEYKGTSRNVTIRMDGLQYGKGN